MKRLILLALLLLSGTTMMAQNYIVVNSEKIFKSIAAYNQALTTLDELAKQYQSQSSNYTTTTSTKNPCLLQRLDKLVKRPS